MRKYKKIIYTVCFLFLISLDQISKYIIRTKGGFYICNENLAFGIKILPYFFYILWVVIIFFILLSLYKKYFIHSTLYILLILSGGISNIIDRLSFGCVIDFIDLKFWPVFNFADIYITLGAILILINHSKSKRKINF